MTFRACIIVDNSVFPSALSVNPALTIMALSLRTADRFLDGFLGQTSSRSGLEKGRAKQSAKPLRG